MKTTKLFTQYLYTRKKILSLTFGRALASLVVSQVYMVLVYLFTFCIFSYTIPIVIIQSLSVIGAIILIIRE